ncbi:MAG: hypothetical protein ACI4KM_09670 [Oscillospiraceae bacterium]
MILMWIIVIGFGIAVTALSAVMVILSQVLTVAAIIFAVLNFLVMLALVIVIIVLTKKGKFSRDFLGRLRESSHGAWKYWGMRILQIVLWVMAVWSLIMTALCILCAVLKPLDFLIVDTSKLCFVMSIL